MSLDAPSPWIATAISALALIVSSLNFLRDRPVLKATSKLIEPPDDNPYVHVHIVNKGRRAMILRMWGGDDGKDWNGSFFGNDKQGLRLGENEMHEFTLYRHDLFIPTPYADVIYADLWVEDTHGRRHEVRDAKRNLAKLWGPPREEEQ